MINRLIAVLTTIALILRESLAVKLPSKRNDLTIKENNEQIKSNISKIQDIETTYRVTLDKNPEFHDWIMEHSRQELPMRLQRFTTRLTKYNMSRRLFYIYKYEVGRDRASRDGYLVWLTQLADWFEEDAKQKNDEITDE